MSNVKERLKELKGILTTTVAANEAIVQSITGDGTPESPAEFTEEKRTAFQANLAAMGTVKSEIALLQESEEGKSILDTLSGRASDPVAIAAAALQAANMGRGGVKTVGRRFIESDEFKSMMTGGSANMARPFQVKGDLGAMWAKDIYSTLPTGGIGGFGQTDRDALVMMQHRTSRVRDLFPARPTSASIIEFFRVTGFTNAASVVPDRAGGVFALKPQSALAFTGQQAAVRTIAHWEAIHRNTLADEPALQALIEGELLYGLRLQEDYQILLGTGTGEDLLGILNTPNVQEYDIDTSGVATDTAGDAIRRAMTLAFLAFYEPTGVVMNPADFEKVELAKDSQNRYLFSASMQEGGAPRIWRLPIVQTAAMTANHALVGAFGLGAQLYDREDGHIRIAEQHADFFVRNAIVILAEERLALATKRPEAFVHVTDLNAGA